MSDPAPEEDVAAFVWQQSPTTDIDLGSLPVSDIDHTEIRLLADNLPSLCWIADGDGYMRWYNRSWHTYCGSTPADMEGWGWQSVHDPQILPDVLTKWTACIAAGQAFEMTFPLKGADGIFRPFLTRVTPLRDRDGRVMRWFGNNTDVSPQEKVEAALRASEASLRSLNADLERQVLERSLERGMTWQISPHLLSVINLNDGRFARVNPAWTKTLGWTEEQLTGKAFIDFVHPDDTEAVGPAWNRVNEGEPVIDFENRYRTKDGQYPSQGRTPRTASKGARDHLGGHACSVVADA